MPEACDPLDLVIADMRASEGPQELAKARSGDAMGGAYSRRTGQPGAYAYHYPDGKVRKTGPGSKSKEADAIQGALSKIAPGDSLELIKLMDGPLKGIAWGRVMHAVEALEAGGTLSFDGAFIKRGVYCCGDEAVTEPPEGLNKGLHDDPFASRKTGQGR